MNTLYFLIGFYLSKYYHIPQLRCIHPYLNYTTACTIAISIVHSKLDYCNSLYYNLLKSQITGLQQIQNSLVRAVVKVPKSSYTTLTLRCRHWPKITVGIEYKLPSLIYKVLTTTQPSYLHNFITADITAVLFKKRFRLNVRKYAFSNRVIDWNLLPASCINCSTINTFKKHLSSELESEAVKFKVCQL